MPAGAQRAASNQALERRREDQVDEGLPGGRHAGPLERGAQLFPGPWPLLVDLSGDRLHPALGLGRVDALLFEPAAVTGSQLRRCQRMQPAVVLAVDEMQGAAIQGADDQLARVECPVDIGDMQAGAAGADCEPGAAWVLSLHGEDPAGDRAGIGSRFARQQLGPEPALEDLRRNRACGLRGHRGTSGGGEVRRARRAGARRGRRSSSRARSCTG